MPNINELISFFVEEHFFCVNYNLDVIFKAKMQLTI
jgi:hypothetical protein